MSNNKINIDDLFKKAFNDLEGEASNADWDAIADKMKEAPRRRAFWFLTPAILLLIGGAGAFLSYKYFNKSSSSSSEQGQAMVREIPLKEDAKSNTPYADKRVGSDAQDPAISLRDIPARANASPAKQYVRAQANTPAATSYPVNSNAATTVDPNPGVPAKTLEPANNVAPNPTAQASEEVKPGIEKPDVKVAETKPNAQPNLKTKFIPSIKIGLVVNLNNTYRALSAEPSVHPDYLSIRNSQETSVAKTGIGMKFQFQPLKNLSLESGIHYRETGELGTYNLTRTVFDSIPLLDTNGNVKGYFRFNPHDSTFTTDFNNKYKFVEVPFNISATLYRTSRIEFVAGAGAYFTYLAGASGVYLNPTTLEFSNLNKTKDVFRNLSTGISLSSGVNCSLGSSFELQTIISYRKNVTSLYNSSSAVQMKPNTFGINVGIMYKIK